MIQLLLVMNFRYTRRNKMLKDVEQHREVKGDQYNLAIDYLYGQEYYQKACKDVKDNPDLGSHCK